MASFLFSKRFARQIILIVAALVVLASLILAAADQKLIAAIRDN